VRAEDIAASLEGFDYQPLTSPAVGRLLYDLALSPGVEELLELGTAHGTSTAYIAAALAAKGVGHLTTVDRPDALEREPNVHQVLERLGLERWVTVARASSYNRVLMRMLEEATLDDETRPCLDFCFLDGAHTWETDGFAVVLVDRLLRPGGWIVLDDVEWSLADSPELRDSERVKSLTEEERTERGVRKIVDLILRTTPGYEVRLFGNLAFAFKGPADAPELQRLHTAATALLRELVGSRQSAHAA
jgi:predicted O-methyltransferase YrrM